MDKVAIITDIFLPLTQTFVYEEISAIQKYNIFVLTRLRQNENIFPYKNIYVSNNSPTTISEFYKMIINRNMKLIHVKFGTSALRYVKLKTLTGLPFIVSFHGYDASDRLKNPFTLYRYKKELFPCVDHIITVSQKLKHNLVKYGCPANKISVISSGIDTESFSFKPRSFKEDEPVKILSIGRLTEKKGFRYLIDAYASVVKVRPRTLLTIIGEGDLKEDLQNQIERLGLSDRIHIQNFISHSEVIKMLHSHHIFCLPSTISSTGDEEGIPNVLKEALSTGMPIVSTYHSGIPELIDDGKSGFLVEEKNSALLAEKILFLIDHPEIWMQMGTHGRKHIKENFDKFIQAQKIENLYSKFI